MEGHEERQHFGGRREENIIWKANGSRNRKDCGDQAHVRDESRKRRGYRREEGREEAARPTDDFVMAIKGIVGAAGRLVDGKKTQFHGNNLREAGKETGEGARLGERDRRVRGNEGDSDIAGDE